MLAEDWTNLPDTAEAETDNADIGRPDPPLLTLLNSLRSAISVTSELEILLPGPRASLLFGLNAGLTAILGLPLELRASGLGAVDGLLSLFGEQSPLASAEPVREEGQNSFEAFGRTLGDAEESFGDADGLRCLPPQSRF